MGDSVPRMKALLATLLLLFQLQPVLGTVACLGLPDRAAQRECEMPDQGQMPTARIAVFEGQAPTCQLAVLCTPSPLSIPGSSASLETAVPLLEAVGVLAAILPLGISPVPPFHPPRV